MRIVTLPMILETELLKTEEEERQRYCSLKTFFELSLISQRKQSLLFTKPYGWGLDMHSCYLNKTTAFRMRSSQHEVGAQGRLSFDSQRSELRVRDEAAENLRWQLLSLFYFSFSFTRFGKIWELELMSVSNLYKTFDGANCKHEFFGYMRIKLVFIMLSRVLVG